MFQGTGYIIDRYENRRHVLRKYWNELGREMKTFARYCDDGHAYLYVLTMVCVYTFPLAALGLIICSINDVNNS